MKSHHFFLFCSALLLGCRTSQPIVEVVPQLSHDTLYLTSLQYDSVFIFQDRSLDRTRDTIRILDRSVEYRYRLLRDTVFRTRVDSIPVIREVEVVKVEQRVPFWAKVLSWVGVIALLFLLARLLLFLRGK